KQIHTMIWRLLIPGLWLAWIAYWLVSATGNKTIVRRESPGSQLSYKLPLLIGGLLLTIYHWPGHWLSRPFLFPPHILFPLGAILVVLGLGFSVWARVHIGGNWSGIVTLKKDHQLIRTGPYRWVRHPIYTGILLALLGTVLAIGQWRGLIALGFMTCGFIRKLRIEEQWLGEAFGPEYDAYKKEVSALIPGVY
ncbi:MAG TPA: isoprenylcysteine carboxylmethyltransferase family protein, partial [Candidatus Methylacidiphilales bacterium]|nr:isoprenylcysteine carboxylmethyltransferase family protein [Candidatus Methylacidiphilales bacterium]